MKKTNQAEAGASLSGCVDFDRYTAVQRRAGLYPSVKRAPDSKRHGSLAFPQPVQARWRASLLAIETPVQFRAPRFSPVAAISRSCAVRSQTQSQIGTAIAKRPR